MKYTNKDLQNALFDLEAFLDDNPHLRSYQEEVNRMLDEIGPDPELRMAKILELITHKHHRAFKELKEVIDSLKSLREEAFKKASGD